MSTPKIYIAGKVTGLPIKEVTEKFKVVQKELESNGYEVVNPIEVVGDPETSWKKAMKLCIAALVQCNSIYMLPCWEQSKGATIEYNLAKALGLRILKESI